MSGGIGGKPIRRLHEPVVAPFFEKLDPGPTRPRLLLISYHFPPSQSAGALRWQKLCEYGIGHGWNMDVITLDHSMLEKRDMHRLDELPVGTKVYGVLQGLSLPEKVEASLLKMVCIGKSMLAGRNMPPVADASKDGGKELSQPSLNTGSINAAEITWPNFFANLRTGLRRFFLAWVVHGQSAHWSKDAAKLGSQLAKTTRYKAVITCGPPHMVHEAGRMVAIREKLPLIIDMRDPWSLIQRVLEPFASPLLLALARRYERKSVSVASLIVTNTESHRLALQKVYPKAASRIVTVMNGYDEEQGVEVGQSNSKFTIAYAGSIYLDRDPRNLFAAVGQLVTKLKLTEDDLSIELMGDVMSFAGIPTKQLAAAAGIDGFIRLYESRPRRQALAFLARATVLVNLPQDSDMAIPSKIFEYMQFNAWILAIERPGSAVESLLRDSEADIVEPNDVEKMVLLLERRYKQFRNGIMPKSIASNVRFSRKEQAGLFFKALESCGIGGQTQ